MASKPEGRSSLREFLSFLATVRGDLSNITAPPFLLAPQSIVELPCYWAEKPSIFVAPAQEPDPQKRTLLVLKWFLSSLKQQCYVGRDVKDGVKKPLNAFLGEKFLGRYSDGAESTRVISEQVSHHPPITACYVHNEEHGIRAEGYSRQEMTFNGSINIKQTGHAMLHIDRYDEDHLIPLPSVKVKGFLSGTPYPELVGTYYIVSSSGFTSEINFSECGYFSGARNRFEAKVYQTEDKRRNAIYTVSGQWSGRFTFRDAVAFTDIETYDVNAARTAPLNLPCVEKQDPWESRKAWQNVLEALTRGDVPRTIAEKSKLEEAQRALRKREASDGIVWKPALFTQRTGEYRAFDRLASSQAIKLEADKTRGVWQFNRATKATKPYHGALTPLG